jgi:hypothetical protein
MRVHPRGFFLGLWVVSAGLLTPKPAAAIKVCLTNQEIQITCEPCGAKSAISFCQSTTDNGGDYCFTSYGLCCNNEVMNHSAEGDCGGDASPPTNHSAENVILFVPDRCRGTGEYGIVEIDDGAPARSPKRALAKRKA